MEKKFNRFGCWYYTGCSEYFRNYRDFYTQPSVGVYREGFRLDKYSENSSNALKHNSYYSV